MAVCLHEQSDGHAEEEPSHEAAIPKDVDHDPLKRLSTAGMLELGSSSWRRIDVADQRGNELPHVHNFLDDVS